MTKSKLVKQLFVDRFSPSSLKGFILPKRIKKQFSNGIYTNVLMHGSPGIGKSSLGKLLIDKHPNIYINASEEGRMDVLRQKVTDFCSEVQVVDDKDSDIKVVMFDEIDGVSYQFFEALRGFMDEFSENVRFVATANYISKIPRPIQSRFEVIDFGFSGEEEEEVYKRYGKRMRAIMEKKLDMKIEYDALKLLVDKNFPDFRGALQTIQRLYVSGVEEVGVEDIKSESYQFREVYQLIMEGAEPEEIHKEIASQYADKTDDLMRALGTDFITYVEDNHPDVRMNVIPRITILSAKYQDMLHRSIDPVITMKACIFEMSKAVQEFK